MLVIPAINLQKCPIEESNPLEPGESKYYALRDWPVEAKQFIYKVFIVVYSELSHSN